MTKVQTKAPCRIDLFGGTLDLWPLYLWYQPCATTNVAISVMTSTELDYVPGGNSITLIHEAGQNHEEFKTTFPLDPTSFKDPWKLSLQSLLYFSQNHHGTYTLKTSSEAPLGSGLAASSSQLISLIAALNHALGKGHTREELQKIARDIETQVLQKPAGEQDYFPALFGGIGALNLEVGCLSHNKISKLQNLFEEELLVFYTGKPHHSGLSNWEIYQKAVNGDREIVQAMKALALNSQIGITALQNQDVPSLKKAIRKDWDLRKKAFDGWYTSEIKEAEKLLESLKVTCFKACGAAAGGCMFTLVPKADRPPLLQALQESGMTPLDAQLHSDGVSVDT